MSHANHSMVKAVEDALAFIKNDKLCEGFSSQQVEFALLHELMHIVLLKTPSFKVIGGHNGRTK